MGIALMTLVAIGIFALIAWAGCGTIVDTIRERSLRQQLRQRD